MSGPRAADRLRRARHHVARAAGDWAAVAAGWTGVEAARFAGRPEAAFARLAHLIRHVEAARESLWAYRAAARLARRTPGLARFRSDGQLPERFLLFVGYARSGHSLVGSLLDAHPEIVVSHETYALKHLLHGASYAEVVEAIKLNACIFHEMGRSYSGYDYLVPGQQQGTYGHLRLLGDKKGNGNARLIGRRPEVLERLDREVPVPTSFVHVVRNPFDNIATKARRTGTSLERAAHNYFANAEVIAGLKARYGARVVDVYLDELVAAPRAALGALLGSLGIDAVDEAYLEACAGVVFDAPRRTGAEIAWEPGLVRRIEERLAGYPFLARFREPEARPPAAAG